MKLKHSLCIFTKAEFTEVRWCETEALDYAIHSRSGLVDLAELAHPNA
jgi:hypothetical protein